MSLLPKVAIVGRPNVGKSSLFNRLIGKRLALVHNEPGVTRDRLYGEVEWGRHRFEVIDTGGLEPGDRALIRQHIHKQVDRAVAEAQAIVFMVDGKEGLSGLDQDAANRVRKSGRKVILVINKIDDPSKEAHGFEFARLGLGQGIWISSTHGLNVDALLDAVVALFEAAHPSEQTAPPLAKVAIVGRPNVGKSSLINRLIEDERVLVDDQPGTTRDPVPVPYKKGQSDLLLVDTAGIRRASKVDSPIEQISSVMARRALDAADLAVLVLDAASGIQSQDQRIAGLIQDARKPVVIAVNKWDLASGPWAGDDGPAQEAAAVPDAYGWLGRQTPDSQMLADWEELLEERLGFLSWAPRVKISATKGFGMDELIAEVEKVRERCRTFLTTGKLNSLLREAALVHPAPTRKGKQLLVRYASQLKNRTATFVFKVNDPKLVHFSYQRHLERVLRDAVDFSGVPLTLVFKPGSSRSRLEHARPKR